MAHLEGLLSNKRSLNSDATTTRPRHTKKHRSVSKVLSATKRYISSRVDELKDIPHSDNKEHVDQINNAIQFLNETVATLSSLVAQSSTATAAATAATTATTAAASSSTTTVAPKEWQFNHQAAQPLPPGLLNQINWQQCIGVQRSDTGTDGVLFAMFQNQTAVCIKAPGSIAAEVYGSWLAKRIGVPTPALRLVDRNGTEGQQIIAMLMSPNICTTVAKKSRIERIVLRPFFLVMEYVRGIALEDMFQPISGTFIQNKFGGNGSSNATATTPTATTPTATTPTDTNTIEPPPSQQQFHQIGLTNLNVLGKVIALDILTNNFDRLPCIWENNGNPGNIMFQPEPKHTALCIDNMVSCIDVEKFQNQYQQYVKKATNMLQRLLPSKEEEGAGSKEDHGNGNGNGNGNRSTTNNATLKEFERVRIFLKDGTGNGGWPGLGCDIGIRGMDEIQQGFFRCMLAFASVPRKEFVDVKDALHEAMKDSLTEHNTWGLERVHPEFIFQIADALHHVADRSKAFNTTLTDGGGDPTPNGTVPEMAVIPPDSSLMPERNDTKHRKLSSRQTQQQNLTLLNNILSNADIHVTTAFVPSSDDDDDDGSMEKNGTPTDMDENNKAPPRTPTRSPRPNEYESIASPALLRKLEGRGQTSEVCVVM